MTMDLSQFRTLDQDGNVRQMTREEVLALRPGVQLHIQPPKLTLLATGEPLAELQVQLRNGLGEDIHEPRTLTFIVNQGEDRHEVQLDNQGHAKLRLGVVLRAGQHVLTVEEMPGTLLFIDAEAAEPKVTNPNVDYLLLGKRLLRLEQGDISVTDIDQATPDELRAILKGMLKKQQQAK